MPDREALGRATLAAQTRLHRRSLNYIPGATFTVALALVASLWPLPSAKPLLVWLGVVALAVLLHFGVQMRQREGVAHEPEAPRWRRQHHMAIAVQGLAWAGLALVMEHVPEGPGHDAIAFAGVAMMAGWITTGSFDRVAVALFTVPAFLPAALHFGAHLKSLSALALGSVALVVTLMLLAAQRGHRAFVNSVERRVVRERAANQARVLEQLLQNTEQGVWFLDNQGLTTDLNPAMARLLGRDREAVLGRSVFDFFAGADLATLNHQLELRKKGNKEGYEIGIVQPDGHRIECFNNATPIYDAQGAKIGSVGLWTNLTPLKRALADVESGRQELFALLDAFPGFVVSMDQDGRYSFMNQRMARWYGRTPKDMVGRHVSEFTTPERWRDIQAWQVRADRGEILVEEREYKPRRPGDKMFWMQSTRMAGLKRPDGSRSYYSFGLETTDRVQREAERQAHAQQMQTLLNSFPGGIAAIDHEGRYTFVNQVMADILRRPAEQVTGRLVEEILPLRAERLRQELQLLRQGQVLTEEVPNPQPDGGPHTYFHATRVASPPDREGRHTYYAFTIDITERKRAEQRAVAAREEAERASQAKTQFLSQMSHELRTPLNAILGFGQLLASDRQWPLAPAQELKVQEILTGAGHLLNLINGLLDLGRIEEGRFAVELQPIDLEALVGEALALMQPVGQRQGVQVPDHWMAPHPGLTVQADRTRLMQVLLNLIGNAIKYNRAGGAVALECRETDDRVWLGVRDEGKGLSDEDQNRLFEPFQRLGAERSGIEGTGIGLALSRRLMQAMGGQIGVDSTPGQGATFWLRLPAGPLAAVRARAADENRPVPPSDKATSSANGTAPPGLAPAGQDQPMAPLEQGATCPVATVLYIEDNPVNAMVMEAMVTRLPGLTMMSADDGAPGLEMALSERPDLILTDIQMPGMDGFELMSRLQQHEQTRNIPVIAISADALPESVERGRQAGFADYLTKPVEMGALHAAIRTALGLRS